MRYDRIASAVLMVMFAFFAAGCSSRVETAREEAAKTIPDLSGIWEAPDELNSVYETSNLCGESACGELFDLPDSFDLITTIEEPQMLPWAEERSLLSG